MTSQSTCSVMIPVKEPGRCPRVRRRSPSGVFHKWGYPKWLVYNGKSLYKWDDLGVPLFQETTMCLKSLPLKKNCSWFRMWRSRMVHIEVPDSATDLSGSGTFAPGSKGVGAPRWSGWVADVGSWFWLLPRSQGVAIFALRLPSVFCERWELKQSEAPQSKLSVVDVTGHTHLGSSWIVPARCSSTVGSGLEELSGTQVSQGYQTWKLWFARGREMCCYPLHV